MFSYVASLFQRSPASDEGEDSAPSEQIDHAVSEEAGDWLVISTKSDDSESVCSEESWVITPSPRFRLRSTPPDTHSSLENLLIEHPTMSVYSQRPSSATAENVAEETDDHQTQEPIADKRNTNTDLVLKKRNTRAKKAQRMRLATQLGVPLHLSKQNKPPLIPRPKPARRMMHRQNQNYLRVARGKKAYKMQHCGVKTGKRRC